MNRARRAGSAARSADNPSMADDKSPFNIPEEFGSWVDERFANAINAATTPENLANFATAISGALQGFLTGEIDRVITGAEANAQQVITALLTALGTPVTTVIGDVTAEVKSTGDGLSTDISGIMGSITSLFDGLVTQVINGLAADLPHLLNKEDPKTPKPDADTAG